MTLTRSNRTMPFQTIAGPIAGIVLAAGLSKRFGRTKLLEKLGGRPVLEWVLVAALESNLDRVVLVLGHDRKRMVAALGAPASAEKLRIVFNPRYPDGQGTSLAAGLRAVQREFPAVMFLLGDQPRITAAAINLLLQRFRQAGKKICVPVQAGIRRNPVLFDRDFYPTLLGIEGDKGAREIIAANPQQVSEVAFDDPGLFQDVDTPQDLSALEALYLSNP
jgi:molybdenum cofactor cytidylyltransferase